MKNNNSVNKNSYRLIMDGYLVKNDKVKILK